MTRALPLAAALLLAGCFGGGDAPEADPDALAPSADNASPSERPDGREGGFAAFNETNRTEEGAGGLDHAHDYWGGRERVTLHDATVGLALCCSPRLGAMATLSLPPGLLVYEGAGAVEVTVSDPQRRACTNVYVDNQRLCSDAAAPRVPDPAGGPKGVHLFVRDASSQAYQDLGPVAWGSTLVLPITKPQQTDMPHATVTLWGVQLRSSDPADDSLMAHVKVEVVRGAAGDIPKWPGHPELYADAPVRTVLQASARTSETGPAAILDPSGRDRQVVPAQKLVTHGTRTLHVFVNVTDLEVANPALQPTDWVLSWHNASGVLRSVSGEGHAGDVREHRWVLPVDDAGMDSPYADGSRWGFLLWGAATVGADTPQGRVSLVGCNGLCAVYDVAYDITVLATGEALPEDAYDVPPA